MQIEFERAVIATFLYADMSQAEKQIKDTELREEWFTNHTHKLIAHAINHLKATGFYDELTVKDYLSKNSSFNLHDLELCMTANIAGTMETLNHWINHIKRSRRSAVARI